MDICLWNLCMRDALYLPSLWVYYHFSGLWNIWQVSLRKVSKWQGTLLANSETLSEGSRFPGDRVQNFTLDFFCLFLPQTLAHRRTELLFMSPLQIMILTGLSSLLMYLFFMMWKEKYVWKSVNKLEISINNDLINEIVLNNVLNAIRKCILFNIYIWHSYYLLLKLPTHRSTEEHFWIAIWRFSILSYKCINFMVKFVAETSM